MGLTYGFGLGPEDTLYTSAEFSDAFFHVFGNGVTKYGRQFSILSNGFSVTVNTGYALVNGRYVENSEVFRKIVPYPYDDRDRVDAVMLTIKYLEREAVLDIVEDVDMDAVLANPSLLRNRYEYSCVLYFIKMMSGTPSISPDDIIDVRGNSEVCGYIERLSNITNIVLYLYRYFTVDIEEEIDKLFKMVEELAKRCDEQIEAINKQIYYKGADYSVGDLYQGRKNPEPENEWVLCDGQAIKPIYLDLRHLIGGTAPNISKQNDRYRTYIYAGQPVDEKDVYYPFVPSGSTGLVTADGKIFKAMR